MKTQKKIENWCRDEKFMRYADKRMGEAFNDVVENQPLDPQYEELDEEFEWNDRYLVGVYPCVHAGTLPACIRRGVRPARDRVA